MALKKSVMIACRRIDNANPKIHSQVKSDQKYKDSNFRGVSCCCCVGQASQMQASQLLRLQLEKNRAEQARQVRVHGPVVAESAASSATA